MIRWKSLRISLLATTFGGVLFVMGKSIFSPIASNRTVAPFIFPSEVPLQNWQLLASRPLAAQATGNEKTLSGRHYQYIHNGLLLDIEMRYIVDTDGDVQLLLQHFSFIPPSVTDVLNLYQRQEGGFYSLFVQQKKAYLSACINPYGGSTVTNVQFVQNRNTYDLQLNCLLPWLFGREPLTDRRCLWTNLSIPFKNTSPAPTYQTLETVWDSWYRWWVPRFPKP